MKGAMRMLLAAARESHATTMDYYEKRIEALKNALPNESPYEFDIQTDIIEDGYPVTYVKMTRFNKCVKTWVLVVTDEKMSCSDSTPEREIIPLNRFSNWSKVKRFIQIQVKNILNGIPLEDLPSID